VAEQRPQTPKGDGIGEEEFVAAQISRDATLDT
jgi:hypothetical protein